jgi:non-SMC mitotic condensation complex subunit 1
VAVTLNLTVSKTVVQDPHPMVRRHALLLLSRLLLQDFLKWRGLLLFRFLACLADSDPQVAQVRDTCITCIMQTSFVLAVVVYRLELCQYALLMLCTLAHARCTS